MIELIILNTLIEKESFSTLAIIYEAILFQTLMKFGLWAPKVSLIIPIYSKLGKIPTFA